MPVRAEAGEAFVKGLPKARQHDVAAASPEPHKDKAPLPDTAGSPWECPDGLKRPRDL